MLPVVQDESSDRLKRISNFLTSFEFEANQNSHKSKEQNVLHDKEREEFDRRMLTYKNSFWTIPEISPLHCAQHGWYLLDAEMLQCSVCKAFLCIRLPLNNQREAYVEFLSVLEDGIQTGHDNSCSYRHHISPQEFVQPSFKLTDLKNLSATANTLCTIGNSLPLIKTMTFLSKINLNQYHLSILFKIGDALDDVKLTAAILTLCGWSCEKNSFLKCNFCLKTVGLWNYFSLEDENAYQKYEKRNLRRLRRKQKEEQLTQIIGTVPSKEDASDENTSSIEEYVPTVQSRRRESISEDEMDFVELENTIEDVYEEDNLLNESSSEKATVVPENHKDEYKPNSDTASLQQNVEKMLVSQTDGSRMLKVPKMDAEKADAEATNSEQQSTAGDASSIPFSEQETSLKDSKIDTIKTFSDDENSTQNDSASNSSNDLWAEALRPNEEAANKQRTMSSGSSSSRSSTIVFDEQQNDLNSGVKAFDHDQAEPSIYADVDINEARPNFENEQEICEKVDDDQLPESCQENPQGRKRRRSSSDDDVETSSSPSSKRVHDEQGITSETNIQDVITKEASDTLVSVDQVEEEEDYDEEESRSPFDPLEEHCHWCAWLWKAPHKGKEVPGYLIIPPQLKAIVPQSPTDNLSKSRKYGENIEGLRAIRTFLEECTFPTRTHIQKDQMEV